MAKSPRQNFGEYDGGDIKYRDVNGDGQITELDEVPIGYPTLMELCRVKTDFDTDGKSMVQMLQNPETAQWQDAAWSYFNRGISLRTSRYRITRYFRNPQPVIELYDHQADPFENRNVAEENPEVVKELLLLLGRKQFFTWPER